MFSNTMTAFNFHPSSASILQVPTFLGVEWWRRICSRKALALGDRNQYEFKRWFCTSRRRSNQVSAWLSGLGLSQ